MDTEYYKIKKDLLWKVLAGVSLFIGIIFSVYFYDISDYLVGAATFDSDIVPATGSIRIGVSQGQIKSINDLIFFNGQQTGIGADPTGVTSTVRLQLDGGGLRFSNLGTEPNCTTTLRGTIWYKAGGFAQPDKMMVCLRDATGVYTWATFQGK